MKMNLRLIDKSGIVGVASICTAFFFFVAAVANCLLNTWCNLFNGSEKNYANSSGGLLSDLTTSQYEFRQCIVLIHLNVNIIVVKIIFSRGNSDTWTCLYCLTCLFYRRQLQFFKAKGKTLSELSGSRSDCADIENFIITG